jgi:long-chain acyl-CoA synthetase
LSNPKEFLAGILYKQITLPQDTMQALFDYSVEHSADRPCISFVGEQPITYRVFGEKVRQIQQTLYSAGLTKGDKIAILSQNMPNWVIAYFAITTGGMTVVPLLPDFSKTEVENILEHSDTKALFVSEKQLAKIADIQLDAISFILKLDDFSIVENLTSIKDFNKNAHERLTVSESDLCAIIYTSGTTGRSKGVMLTHKNIVWNAAQSFMFQTINSHDVFLSFLPLSHTYENTIGMVFPIMYGASICYLDRPPTPAALLPALAKVRPTLMLSVPLVMEKIYQSQVRSKFIKNKMMQGIYKTPVIRMIIHRIAGKKLKKAFGSRLKFFGIGGSRLDSRVERFLKEAKFPYAIGYGLTETAPLLAGAGVKYTRNQSTGFAVEGVTLKINEPNNKRVGEIWAKGPNVMLGYYKNPELTDEVLTPDGWFKTGDLGKITRKHKRLFVKGRLKSTIIGANGENIYPEDIESVINNIPYVVESLVIEKEGLLVAKILLNIEELAKHIEKYHVWIENLKTEINLRINRTSQIRKVELVDAPFEKTASMKIRRFLYTGKEGKK